MKPDLQLSLNLDFPTLAEVWGHRIREGLELDEKVHNGAEIRIPMIYIKQYIQK